MTTRQSVAAYLDRLGLSAEDKVTGFKGTIQSVNFDLYGCVQYHIVPPVNKEDKIPDGHWFDSNRLEYGSEKTRKMPIPEFAEEPENHDHGPATKNKAGFRG